METAGKEGPAVTPLLWTWQRDQMKIFARGRARICPCHSLRKRTGGILPGLLGPRQRGLGFLTCIHCLCESMCPESSWFFNFFSQTLLPLQKQPAANKPFYPTGHDIYSTIKKSQQNGKIPRFRRVRGGGELYTSDTVMQSKYRGNPEGVGPAALPLQADELDSLSAHNCGT